MENMTVLFVDDEPRILSALERGMAKESFRRRYAQGWKEALEVIAATSIHVVVADMKMPGMDGLTFLRQVKKISPHTVRVVLSGFLFVSQIIPCINTGEVFRYVTKPLDIRDLVQILHEAMNRYYLRKEYENKLEKLMAENCDLRKSLMNNSNKVTNN